MIEGKRANFILNEAKNAGDAKVSARLFNEVQDEIRRLQPIDGNLDKLYTIPPEKQMVLSRQKRWAVG